MEREKNEEREKERKSNILFTYGLFAQLSTCKLSMVLNRRNP